MTKYFFSIFIQEITANKINSLSTKQELMVIKSVTIESLMWCNLEFQPLMCDELQIVVLLLFLRVSVYSISSRWLSSSSLTHKILDCKDSFDLKNLEKYLIAGHLVI